MSNSSFESATNICKHLVPSLSELANIFFDLLDDRSTDQSLPSLLINSAICVDFPPGAAQASRIFSPGKGPNDGAISCEDLS